MREAIHPEGKMFTPYGATEALPVASIESREVLGETAAKASTWIGDMRWSTVFGNRMESDCDR